MVFYDSRWQDSIDTGISTGAYILFYQGASFDHCTHVPGVNLTLSTNHPMHPNAPAKISAHAYTQIFALIRTQQRTITPNFAYQ